MSPFAFVSPNLSLKNLAVLRKWRWLVDLTSKNQTLDFKERKKYPLCTFNVNAPEVAWFAWNLTAPVATNGGLSHITVWAPCVQSLSATLSTDDEVFRPPGGGGGGLLPHTNPTLKMSLNPSVHLSHQLASVPLAWLIYHLSTALKFCVSTRTFIPFYHHHTCTVCVDVSELEKKLWREAAEHKRSLKHSKRHLP